MFSISSEPLIAAPLQEACTNPEAGALVTFEGWVRNHNAGKAVVALEYEAYQTMAIKEGQRILEEARARFDILEAHCVHRVGKLAIGEMAVWVGVASAHRQEAYQASRFIIDAVKQRVPIWKKEYYPNGDSGWVNCEQCDAHHHEPPVVLPEAYYARQVCLPDIGWSGQEKLKQSRVLVVGAGGLGSPALMYLAAAGVGTLGICDFDTVEVSNLHRQPLFRVDDIGEPKATVAARQLQAINPFIQVQTHLDALEVHNAVELFAQYDLVLDCTDNFPAKFLLNDAAILTETPLIQASIYQYEGQMQRIDPRQPRGGCLRCLWPTLPDPGCVGSCAEVGVFGAVAGVFGTLQAVEALKVLLGFPDALSADTLLLFNVLTYQAHRIRQPQDPQCPLCGEAPRIRQLEPNGYQDTRHNGQLASLEAMPQGAILVDIREPHEREAVPFPVEAALAIPFSRFDMAGDSRLEASCDYVLVCSSGVRSSYLVKGLRKRGYANFYSLAEGMHGLAQSAMPSLSR